MESEEEEEKQVCRREKQERGKMAVEFCQANRGPILEKDTCKLIDEPIAS